MVKYRYEAGSHVVGVEREAAAARDIFVNMLVRDKEDHNLRKQRLANRFLVKGRVYSGGVLWDVYALSGAKDPVLIAGDFAWKEEAIAFARDRKLGRNAVSFGGVRGLFKNTSGGISVPSRNIERPGSENVSIQQTNKGLVVG